MQGRNYQALQILLGAIILALPLHLPIKALRGQVFGQVSYLTMWNPLFLFQAVSESVNAFWVNLKLLYSTVPTRTLILQTTERRKVDTARFLTEHCGEFIADFIVPLLFPIAMFHLGHHWREPQWN